MKRASFSDETDRVSGNIEDRRVFPSRSWMKPFDPSASHPS